MKSADLEAVLGAVAAPPPVRSQGSLPCRALIPGPLWPETVREHLSSLAVPGRTVALLTGNAGELDGVDAVIVKWAHARTQALAAALQAGEVQVAAYRPDVAALTGLGPGLTPTGDDLLVGVAAMARRLSDADFLGPQAADSFATALAGFAPTLTTPAAAALLEKASRGLYPSVLAAVVEQLGNPEAEPAAIVERVNQLAAVGAHSGADLLAGALALLLGVVFPRDAR